MSKLALGQIVVITNNIPFTPDIWEYFTGGGKDDDIAFKHPAIFPEQLAAKRIAPHLQKLTLDL